jgi:hypothetical protein
MASRLEEPGATGVHRGGYRPASRDIRTRDGVVIELQASAIDAIEIAEREVFYGNMIWLLDGRSWRAAGRFRFAPGRFRHCETCTTELPSGMLRTRSGCTSCRVVACSIVSSVTGTYGTTGEGRSMERADPSTSTRARTSSCSMASPVDSVTSRSRSRTSAVPVPPQLALALKTLCGFDVPQIAERLFTRRASTSAGVRTWYPSADAGVDRDPARRPRGVSRIRLSEPEWTHDGRW